MNYWMSIFLQNKEEWFSLDPGMNLNWPFVPINKVGEDLYLQTHAVLSFTHHTYHSYKEVVMKHFIRKSLALVLFLLSIAGMNATIAQPVSSQEVMFSQRNLGGPRLGVTYVFGSEIDGVVKSKGIGQTLSQFGWHFEYQVIPDSYGPSFVIQFVPLVAGVEYGTLIPSATLAMGIRFPDGYEFGLGPNILLGAEKAPTALVLAVGKTINYGGVSIPLNIVLATNPAGTRLSFIFGYAIAKASK